MPRERIAFGLAWQASNLFETRNGECQQENCVGAGWAAGDADVDRKPLTQRAGEFDEDVDADAFAISLSGLMDGLGVQVTLGQPDVTPERMIERCLALAEGELGCTLRPSGSITNPGKQEVRR